MSTYRLVCPRCALDLRVRTLKEADAASRVHYAATGHVPRLQRLDADP